MPDLPPIQKSRQRAVRDMNRPLTKRKQVHPERVVNYSSLVDGIGELLEAAPQASARTVNAFMTATYWEVGRRLVEFEQKGRERAQYGKELLKRLSGDLTTRYGRGFSVDNLESMRLFYGVCGLKEISAALSRKLGKPGHVTSDHDIISETPSRILPVSSAQTHALAFNLADLALAFPLPWHTT